MSVAEIRTILKEYNEDMKQYVSALLKVASEEFGRHTSALSEDFQSKVSILAEQVVGTNDKVEGLTDKVEGLTGKVENVIRIQKAHTEMIGAVMKDVSEIKLELKNKADKTEVARLERRVRVLEHAAR